MPPKMTKNSPAVKLLVQKIRSGEITDAQSPSQVWGSEAVFQKYKIGTFRTRLHLLRKENSVQEVGTFLLIFYVSRGLFSEYQCASYIMKMINMKWI